MRRKILIFGVAALAAFTLTAQDSKKGAASGILHPELAVAAGTWDAPAAKLGTKPAEAWTATTVAAGVDKKPEAGHAATHVGEIVDFSCYLQLGKHGAAHKSCGQKCVLNGQPIGLLTKDGTLYMVMPEEHDPRRDGGVDAKAKASDYMGQIVEVSGTETMHNGYRALYVQGLTK